MHTAMQERLFNPTMRFPSVSGRIFDDRSNPAKAGFALPRNDGCGDALHSNTKKTAQE
jgi:hypothetical protein